MHVSIILVQREHGYSPEHRTLRLRHSEHAQVKCCIHAQTQTQRNAMHRIEWVGRHRHERAARSCKNKAEMMPNDRTNERTRSAAVRGNTNLALGAHAGLRRVAVTHALPTATTTTTRVAVMIPRWGATRELRMESPVVVVARVMESARERARARDILMRCGWTTTRRGRRQRKSETPMRKRRIDRSVAGSPRTLPWFYCVFRCFAFFSLPLSPSTHSSTQTSTCRRTYVDDDDDGEREW